VRFALAPGKATVAQALAADVVPAIREQEGCLAATLFGDESSGEYGLYVHWTSIEHADAAAPVIGPRLMQALSGQATGPPDIRLFDVLGEND
jgi:quinol monooxygenase YgiN